MHAHIHTDALSLVITALGVALVFHSMRLGGAYLATHGMPAIGRGIGGFATFPGA